LRGVVRIAGTSCARSSARPSHSPPERARLGRPGRSASKPPSRRPQSKNSISSSSDHREENRQDSQDEAKTDHGDNKSFCPSGLDGAFAGHAANFGKLMARMGELPRV